MSFGNHWLDIVPRGPHRWHRLATSFVEHPHWEQSKLYADRLAAAILWMEDEGLPDEWTVFRHVEYRWSGDDKPKAFYTCSPLCAGMAGTTRAVPFEVVDEMPKQSRCEVCGKTRTSGPLFNVASPTERDAANYRVWYEERVAWKLAKESRWVAESNARAAARVAAIVEPPAKITVEHSPVTVYVDDLGRTVYGVYKLTFTEAEAEFFDKIADTDFRINYARANGEAV